MNGSLYHKIYKTQTGYEYLLLSIYQSVYNILVEEQKVFLLICSLK